MIHSKKIRQVFFCDGSTCNITSVRMMNNMKFNGVVRTLSGVAYVLKMRRNLISLGQLVFEGCRYLVVSGTMKIKRGHLILMKGEKCGVGL